MRQFHQMAWEWQLLQHGHVAVITPLPQHTHTDTRSNVMTLLNIMLLHSHMYTCSKNTYLVLMCL